MNFSINDQIVSTFFSGLIPIITLIGVGYLFSILLGGMAKKFPFSRLALIVSLSPLSLVRFLDPSSSFALYLYAMTIVILGLIIDGIGYLQKPQIQVSPHANVTKKEIEEVTESDPNVIIWEKAE